MVCVGDQISLCSRMLEKTCFQEWESYPSSELWIIMDNLIGNMIRKLYDLGNYSF
jgi:hypothetical protein